MPADIIEEQLLPGTPPKLQLTQRVLEPNLEAENYDELLYTAGIALADEWRSRANLNKMQYVDVELEIKVSMPTRSSTFNTQTGETSYEPVDPEVTITVTGDWLDARS